MGGTVSRRQRFILGKRLYRDFPTRGSDRCGSEREHLGMHTGAPRIYPRRNENRSKKKNNGGGEEMPSREGLPLFYIRKRERVAGRKETRQKGPWGTSLRSKGRELKRAN